MKKLIVIPFVLLLSACQSAIMVKPKVEVIIPDQSLYNCPVVDKFPNPDRLTDIQVARLLVELHRNNRTCKNSLEAIEKFLLETKKSIESDQPN